MTQSLYLKQFNNLTQEIQTADQLLSQYPRIISLFGSARIPEDHPVYKKTLHLAKTLTQQGYTILTGGGPGVMQAGNHGAFLAHQPSIGLNLRLDHEQTDNPYLTESILFEHFASRKLSFTLYSEAYIVMEGGFGTLDELFTILILRQTRKIPTKPIILVGRKFWDGLFHWFKSQLLHKGYINQGEYQSLYLCDETEEVLNILQPKA